MRGGKKEIHLEKVRGSEFSLEPLFVPIAILCVLIVLNRMLELDLSAWMKAFLIPGIKWIIGLYGIYYIIRNIIFDYKQF